MQILKTDKAADFEKALAELGEGASLLQILQQMASNERPPFKIDTDEDGRVYVDDLDSVQLVRWATREEWSGCCSGTLRCSPHSVPSQSFCCILHPCQLSRITAVLCMAVSADCCVKACRWRTACFRSATKLLCNPQQRVHTQNNSVLLSLAHVGGRSVLKVPSKYIVRSPL